jgi:hypothetical protein
VLNDALSALAVVAGGIAYYFLMRKLVGWVFRWPR